MAACDDLPSYVLKPIERIPLGQYRQQLRTRLPHDGFVNQTLVKAGRLAARDELLVKRRRIRSTGANGRTRGFHNYQTPIVGDDGVVDDIMPPTQTQRDSNHTPDPIDPDQEEPRHLGFAARHRRIQRSRPDHQSATGRVGRLRFTTQARAQGSGSDHSLQSDSAGLKFTLRSPPRTDTTAHVSFVNDTYEDEQEEYVQPAPDIPELARPRVGYISRFRTHKRARSENEEVDELEDDYGEEDEQEEERENHERAGRAREERRGFIRKVKGFRAPPADKNGGLIYGDPIQEDHNEEDRQEEDIDHPDDLRHNTEQAHDHQDVSSGAAGTDKTRRAPLFLTGGDNLESTTSNTVSGLSHELATGRNQSTAAPTNTNTGTGTGKGSGSGLSGAQLCDNLLTRTALLAFPVLPTKSAREAKRDERAKRIMRKHDHQEVGAAGTNGATNSHRARMEPSAAIRGKGKERQEEIREETEMGDEIVAYQPIHSQIKARRRIEEDQDGEGGYQPRSSQIRRREGFGLVEPGHNTNLDTQSTQAGPIWESSAFDQTSLGKSTILSRIKRLGAEPR